MRSRIHQVRDSRADSEPERAKVRRPKWMVTADGRYYAMSSSGFRLTEDNVSYDWLRSSLAQAMSEDG